MAAGDYNSAAGRWQGIGPYYAMFPTHFADGVVADYTKPDDIVLDPFAGRGTAVFSAAHQGRQGIGLEINPVGWVYGKTKLGPAGQPEVAVRLREIGELARGYGEAAEALPEFFAHCFSAQVRRYLTAARDKLDWKTCPVDRTVMALMLVYLHGKQGAALSNQMRQTKSMAPDYAVRWWRERRLTPPDLDPVDFMISRLRWRYARGLSVVDGSEMYLADSEQEMARIGRRLRERDAQVRLLFTSPPYFKLTNYHYDQWLRLWLLGGPPNANRVPGTSDLRGKFESLTRYRLLLANVFGGAAKLMTPESMVYVRTGLGKETYETTVQTLREVFPGHKLETKARPYSKPTQTRLFGDTGVKKGEIDIILTSS
jgi:DNA methylase